MSHSKAVSKNYSKFVNQSKETRISLWRQLLMLVESTYQDLEKELSKKDCTYPKFRMLFIIYFDGPCNSISISKRLRVSRSNISTFLKRLEKESLIKPCPINSTETRPRYILTNKGISYTEDLLSFHFENVKKIPFIQDPAKMKLMAKFLEKVELS